MAVYDEVDILMSPSGDLTVAQNGDFQMAAPSGVVAQDIMFRARTDWDDFDPHPKLGADLQSLIGEPNTRESATQAENKLLESLTKDGRMDTLDLKIKAVPISLERIVMYTFVNASNFDTNVFTAAVLDYESGIINSPGGGQ